MPIPVAVQLGIPILAGLAGRLFRQEATPSDPGRAGRLELSELLKEQLAQSRTGPGQSTFFRQGRAEISDAVDQRARADQNRAAALGLGGTTFEVAQMNARNRAEVSGIRSLYGEDAARQQAQQAQTLSQLLSLQGLEEQAGARSLARDDQQEAIRNRFISDLFTNATASLFGGRGANA